MPTTIGARTRTAASALALATALAVTACTIDTDDAGPAAGALVIAEQGSFAVGGTMTTAPGQFDPARPADPQGQTYRGDHAYTYYQVPQNARDLPIVMLHGAGQFSKTWETTADGREGFQNLFLRNNYTTYLVDQPRRGDAGRAMVGATITPTPDEQLWFNQFRLGTWPNMFPGVQFSHDPAALDQFYRSMTPNTGPYDAAIISDGLDALFDRIGEGILFTHSQGGGPGWQTAIKNPNVKGIVAFESGSGFVFPKGEAPPPIPNGFDTLHPETAPADQFTALTEIPIVIYYGDNIPDQPSAQLNQDSWRARLEMARLWADAVNRHGGDAKVIHLPEIGITGNTHFPFSDLNNTQIADHVAGFLADKGLDRG
ncbi:alpha/beta fold hydrolase [Nocardia sp. NBC_00881]|uniref:alpha/beta hydrolase n=1 Tax=Nocardia sp. NBC_00881 TaxID=2975995 RepID=UPI00386EB2F8|nr:alpha/beta fold hydrolase [Nocardia sp. NBC_00881]